MTELQTEAPPREQWKPYRGPKGEAYAYDVRGGRQYVYAKDGRPVLGVEDHVLIPTRRVVPAVEAPETQEVCS